MASFREYVDTAGFIQHILEQINAPLAHSSTTQTPITRTKPWSGKKQEIMTLWNTLRQDVPIYMTPINHVPGQEMETYGEDGIRLTGSWQFITGVLARLKEVLALENPNTRLRLIFRGIEDTKTARPDRQSFVFYANLENRSKGKVGRPKVPGFKPKGISNG